ncbi:MAG: hypothetical protein AAF483_26800 [Planctomycetota bacterium]
MPHGDLKSPTALYAKGFAFLVIALLGFAILLWEHFSLRFACVLFITIWGFCRAYYFAFYVIEHYVDSKYKFAGLMDFARYLIGRPRK